MALNLYEPQKFRSQGIEDLATKETLVITNGKITVDVVETKQTVNFAGASFSALEGKGLRWTDGGKSKSLAYKNGDLSSDFNINLAEDQTYKINDVNIIGFTEIGNTVTKSNLKQVGILKNLTVAGSAQFGGFAFANAELNRLGINTDSPLGALTVRENNIDIIVGSTTPGAASIGTVTHSDLNIVTDNTARITVEKSGDVRFYGKIYADELITEKTSPIVFKEEGTDTPYGKGLIWRFKGSTASQLVYTGGPDRIRSTDIFDLDDEKYYSIGGTMVIDSQQLGPNITRSNLTSVGVLTDLQVAGDAAVARRLSTSRIEIGRFAIDENTLEAKNNFKVFVNEQEELRLGSEIVIGNPQNLDKPISIYGRLTVGVATPQDGVAFTVAGPVCFNDKKFISGSTAPRSGAFNKGDICWNTDPKPSDYVGWVCVVPGTPGTWAPFGGIARQ